METSRIARDGFGGQREGKRFAMREQSFIAEKRRSEELVPNPQIGRDDEWRSNRR